MEPRRLLRVADELADSPAMSGTDANSDGPSGPRATGRRYTARRQEGSAEVWEARGEFLRALRGRTDAADQLALSVLPSFEAVVEALGLPGQHSGTYGPAELVGPTARSLCVLPLGGDAVERVQWASPVDSHVEWWMANYNITSAWVREVVAWTLQAWCVEPELQFERPFVRPFQYATAALERERAISFIYTPAWDPTVETRAQARARVIRDFEQYLDIQLDDIESKATSRGFVPMKVKRESEHFDWAVRVQVGRESRASVARSVPRSPDAVKEAVADLLALLALPAPPQQRGGRPRGSHRSAETRGKS
jgi:hypothetical protein